MYKQSSGSFGYRFVNKLANMCSNTVQSLPPLNDRKISFDSYVSSVLLSTCWKKKKFLKNSSKSWVIFIIHLSCGFEFLVAMSMATRFSTDLVDFFYHDYRKNGNEPYPWLIRINHSPCTSKELQFSNRKAGKYAESFLKETLFLNSNQKFCSFFFQKLSDFNI